jgi:hypothetical protein
LSFCEHQKGLFLPNLKRPSIQILRIPPAAFVAFPSCSKGKRTFGIIWYRSCRIRQSSSNKTIADLGLKGKGQNLRGGPQKTVPKFGRGCGIRAAVDGRRHESQSRVSTVSFHTYRLREQSLAGCLARWGSVQELIMQPHMADGWNRRTHADRVLGHTKYPDGHWPVICHVQQRPTGSTR